MKFRKKPVVIEAEQFTHDHVPTGVVDTAGTGGKIYIGFIETLEGRMRCEIGDWIITGVKGERYPCKPEIFEATYEAVES